MSLHPLPLNFFNLWQPRANASTPFSVIWWHHDTFISTKFYKEKQTNERKINKTNHQTLQFRLSHTGQPSDIAFKLISDILTHDSKLIEFNLLQCRLSACVDESVIILQSDKSKCSILWQCCASVRIDWSSTERQPLNDNDFKNPPHFNEMFSITGPCKNIWKF